MPPPSTRRPYWDAETCRLNAVVRLAWAGRPGTSAAYDIARRGYEAHAQRYPCEVGSITRPPRGNDRSERGVRLVRSMTAPAGSSAASVLASTRAFGVAVAAGPFVIRRQSSARVGPEGIRKAPGS
jgi:hypothetical protein